MHGKFFVFSSVKHYVDATLKVFSDFFVKNFKLEWPQALSLYLNKDLSGGYSTCI
jgi:hypothetical protein